VFPQGKAAKSRGVSRDSVLEEFRGFPSGSFSLDKPKAAWYKESGHPARGALQELKVFLQQHFQRVPRVFLRALSFLRELWISPGRRGIREAAFP
jgi:hypothetical protein